MKLKSLEKLTKKNCLKKPTFCFLETAILSPVSNFVVVVVVCVCVCVCVCVMVMFATISNIVYVYIYVDFVMCLCVIYTLS